MHDVLYKCPVLHIFFYTNSTLLFWLFTPELAIAIENFGSPDLDKQVFIIISRQLVLTKERGKDLYMVFIT